MTHRFRARSQLGARTHAFRQEQTAVARFDHHQSVPQLFPWATFRRAKGGVKAHVLLDHDDYLPAYVLISQATMHDAKVLGLLRLNAGSIGPWTVAYNDYRQFARWTDAGVYCVRPHEGDAVYTVADERDVPVQRNIHSDAIIPDRPPGAEQVSASASAHRRVGRGARREIVLLTFTSTSGPRPSPASTRSGGRSSSSSALKQNLRVKSFVERRRTRVCGKRCRHFLHQHHRQRGPTGHLATDGSPTRQHLVAHRSERPHIGSLIDDLALRLLGCHIGRGANHHPHLRRRRGQRDGRRLCDAHVARIRLERLRQPSSPAPSPCHRF